MRSGEGARVGGLLCYGPDQIDVIRRSASYIDRILKGEKPAELRRCEYELVINLKAAKALGPTVPPSLDHRRRVVILAKRPLADDRKREVPLQVSRVLYSETGHRQSTCTSDTSLICPNQNRKRIPAVGLIVFRLPAHR